MPLNKQIVSIPFTGGRETKIDPVIVDKSKLLSLQNAFFSARGTTTRRDAWVGLAGATDGKGFLEIATRANELVAINGAATPKLLSYAENAQAMVSRGIPPLCSLSKDRVHRTTGFQKFIDCAHASGITCFVWQDSASNGSVNGINCTTIDESTGVHIMDSVVVSSSSTAYAPRVCTDGTNFLLCWGDGGTLNGASFALAATSVAHGPTALATDYDTNKPFDCIAGGSGAIVVYSNTNAVDATASARGFIFNSSLSTGATIKVYTTGSIVIGGHVSLSLTPFGTANTFAGLATDGVVTTVYSVILGTSGLTLSLTHAESGITVPNALAQVTAAPNLSGTSVQGFTSAVPAAGTGVFQQSTFQLSTSNSATGVTTFLNSIIVAGNGQIGPGIAARAFQASDGNVYLPMWMASQIQNALYVVDKSGNVEAFCCYQTFGGTLASSGGFAASTPTLSGTGEVCIPAAELGVLSANSGINTTQQGISRIRLLYGRTAAAAPLWHAQAADSLYLSGAYTAMYDGAQVVEAGFFYYPEGITATDGGAAGGGHVGVTGGVYNVCAVYEWVDNNGRRHQSTPSPTVTTSSITAGHKITMTAPTLQLGKRAASTTIVFYRTQAGPGGTFYRDTPVSAPVANNLGLATVSFTSQDNTDTLLAANEVLYTTGGTLINDSPTSCKAIVPTPDGRLAICGLENPLEVRFSQAPIFGTGLQWNENLSFQTRQDFGYPSAMAFQDGNWIIFTPTRKLLVPASFPDFTGNNGPTYIATPLPGDTGCVDQRSLATCPEGTAYQSRHGYYMLTRGLVESYNDFGSAVEADILGQTVSSAVVLEDKSQLRLVVNGFVLAYDFLFGQWSKHFGGIGANITPVSACAWNGLFTMADNGGDRLLQDSLGNYLDLGTTPIVTTHQTAWLKLNGINGFQRVWHLLIQAEYAKAGADSTLTVTVDFDNVFGGANSYQFSTGTAVLAVGGVLPTIRHLVYNQQKCQSIAFTFVDFPVGTLGASPGINLSGMTLELGLKKGAKKLPAATSL